MGIYWAAVWLFFLVTSVLIILAVLFIRTIVKLLSIPLPEKRSINPREAWLLLIPFLGCIWYFIVAIHISKTIKNEYRRAGKIIGSHPTLALGIIVAIFFLLNTILATFQYMHIYIGYTKTLNSLIGLICWIIYWIQISQHKKQLQQLQNAI